MSVVIVIVIVISGCFGACLYFLLVGLTTALVGICDVGIPSMLLNYYYRGW